MNAPAEEIHDAAGAYALDAVDDLERARFEAHLSRCSTCRQDVDDFRDTAHHLAAAVAEDPPPSLRTDVLAAIRDTRQESPFGLPGSRGRGVRPWVTALGVAAAIAIIGLLSVFAIDARNQRDDAQLLADTLAAPDARSVALEGDTGSGRLVWSESEGRSVLVLDGMPQTEEGRAYELWFIEGDTPRSAGVFDPGGERLVEVLDQLPTGAQMIGVTEEPSSGSELPTGPILLLGETQGA